MEHTAVEAHREYLEKIRAAYNLIGKVYCACLKADVVFNAQGFYHFRYHGNGKQRMNKDMFYRLTLLPLVIAVLENATSIDEYRRTNESKNTTEYIALVEKVGKNRNNKIKVILKRINQGNLIFWSVIRLKK